MSLSAVALAHGGTPLVPQAKMGDPLPGLTAQQLSRFEAGKILFNTSLTEANGLGPCFNKASCGNCHAQPLGGTGSQAVTRFGFVDKGNFDPLDDLGGSLLQVSAISDDCLEVVPEEANITSLRVTNSALAFGLVEAIPGQALLDNRDAQPLINRGTAHMVSAFEDDPKKTPPNSHVGRFGWKAQVPTVLTFSADASLNEMGLTNRFVTTENAPNGDQAQLALCDTVADPEDGPDAEGLDFIDHVTFFQRYLAPAPQTPKSGMTGETIFNTIGCAVCHTPSFTTSNDSYLEDAIRNKVIRPYSDFLLHDMGENGDPIVQGQGGAGFVKTPPLWGLRKRDPMWHGGQATPQGSPEFETMVTTAINLHNSQGSQAIVSALAFTALLPEQKSQLIAFLDSLGRIEFDMDEDNDDVIAIDDFIGFADCYTGSGIPYQPVGNPMDHPCAVSDIDQDNDVDLDDFGSFMLVYDGPRRDCNSNRIIDLEDILVGTSTDADNNGIPDSCQPTCDQDVDGTGTVDVDDLLAVIDQWGDCPAVPAPCSADIDANDVVNVDDLLAVINAWGSCP